MSRYGRERDKIERKSTEENYHITYSRKILKKKSTILNLLQVIRASRYTTSVKKSLVVEER